MDTLLFHPKVVHLPIALGMLMPLIATGMLLAWWRAWLGRRGWVVAVALQAVLLGSGIAALRTGEAEEDRVEKLVPERFIEEHEEASEAFVYGSGGVLVLMLLAFALGARKAALPVAAVATFGSFVVLGLDYRAGQAGGSLVYEHGAAQAYTKGAAGAGGVDVGGSKEHGDDD